MLRRTGVSWAVMARACGAGALLLAVLCALFVAEPLGAAAQTQACACTGAGAGSAEGCRFECMANRSRCCRSFAAGSNPCNGLTPPPGHPCRTQFLDCSRNCDSNASAACCPGGRAPAAAAGSAEAFAPAPAPYGQPDP